MKAITLWQPWASLCVIPRPCPRDTDDDGNCGQRLCPDCGGDGSLTLPFKTIETRSWKAPDSLIGERIAIHAAARPVSAYPPNVLRLGSLRCWSIRGSGSFLGFDDPAQVLMERLPLGAVVGTAMLAACIPMHDTCEEPIPDDLLYMTIDGDGPYRQIVTGDPWKRENVRTVDMTDQAPFGDFRPGRWGWLLSDVERFDPPIPARGRQRIWNWEPPT